MTKTKSRILTALALTTALTAPALIAPMFRTSRTWLPR
jgi:serine protease Do